MAKVTIENLLGRFEHCQQERLGRRFNLQTSISPRVVDNWAHNFLNDYPTKPVKFKNDAEEIHFRTSLAAFIYVTARDKDMTAAMLFKLQYSG